MAKSGKRRSVSIIGSRVRLYWQVEKPSELLQVSCLSGRTTCRGAGRRQEIPTLALKQLVVVRFSSFDQDSVATSSIPLGKAILGLLLFRLKGHFPSSAEFQEQSVDFGPKVPELCETKALYSTTVTLYPFLP